MAGGIDGPSEVEEALLLLGSISTCTSGAPAVPHGWAACSCKRTRDLEEAWVALPLVAFLCRGPPAPAKQRAAPCNVAVAFAASLALKRCKHSPLLRTVAGTATASPRAVLWDTAVHAVWPHPGGQATGDGALCLLQQAAVIQETSRPMQHLQQIKWAAAAWAGTIASK